MHEVDSQQLRLLELLRDQQSAPLTFAQLHAGGVPYPASVISELILVGYPIERVYEGGRLAGIRLSEPGPVPAPDAEQQRRRRPWPFGKAVLGTD
jgi:hypothetical protein